MKPLFTSPKLNLNSITLPPTRAFFNFWSSGLTIETAYFSDNQLSRIFDLEDASQIKISFFHKPRKFGVKFEFWSHSYLMGHDQCTGWHYRIMEGKKEKDRENIQSTVVSTGLQNELNSYFDSIEEPYPEEPFICWMEVDILKRL